MAIRVGGQEESFGNEKNFKGPYRKFKNPPRFDPLKGHNEPLVEEDIGGGNVGEILQHLGGKYYRVKLKTGKAVKVEQQAIADDATIPVGTRTVVSQVDGKYYMQVPIWL